MAARLESSDHDGTWRRGIPTPDYLDFPKLRFKSVCCPVPWLSALAWCSGKGAPVEDATMTESKPTPSATSTISPQSGKPLPATGRDAAPAPETANKAAAPGKPAPAAPARKPEIGGPKGPEPTRYGDWEKGGRCVDF